MTLSDADMEFFDANILSLATISYQQPCPVDTDYLRLAAYHGLDDIALASAALQSFTANLSINF